MRGRRLIHRNQRGFTLIELVMAIGVGSLVAGAITMTIFQMLVNPIQSSAHMTAVKQVESAIHWIRHDAFMAQVVEPSGDSGFPLKLTWVEWDNTTNEVTYSLQDGKLQRGHVTYDASGAVIDNQTSVVAQHIDSSSEMTSVQWDGSTLSLKITATLTGFRTSSETRVVEVLARPSG